MRGLKKFLAAWRVSTVGSMFPKTFLRRKNASQFHNWLPGTGFECGRFVACLRGVEDWDLRERQTLLNNKHHKTLLDMFAFAAKNNFNCYNVTGTKVLLFFFQPSKRMAHDNVLSPPHAHSIPYGGRDGR